MKKVLSIAVLLSALAFQSCSESQDSATSELEDVSSERVAVQFSNGVISRASGTTWANDDRIGIYMLLTGTQESYEDVDIKVDVDVNGNDVLVDLTCANIQYYNENTASTIASFEPVDVSQAIYYPEDNEAVDFIASYPYSAALTVDNFLYPLDMRNQLYKVNYDLMTARIVDTNTEIESIEFAFTHVMSHLDFSLKSGDGVPNLSGAEITIKGLINQGTYDIYNDVVDLGDNVASDLVVTDDYAFVIPQKATVIFHVSTTNSPEGFDTVATDVEFKSGETTEIDLTLNRESVDVTGYSTINEWIDAEDIELDAEQVPFASAASKASSTTLPDNVYTSEDPNIGIFMFYQDTNTIVDEVANIEHSATADGVFYVVDEDETIYYPEDDALVDFVAYSPYGTKVGLDDLIYEVESGEDFMLSEKLQDRDLNDEIQEFSFNHMMSQVVVNVSQGSGSPSLDGLEIFVDGLVGSGTCDISADVPQVTPDVVDATTLSMAEGEATVIVPQTQTVTFTVTTTDNSDGFTTASQSIAFGSGETTAVSLTLNYTNITFDDVAVISDWTEVAYSGVDSVDSVVELF